MDESPANHPASRQGIKKLTSYLLNDEADTVLTQIQLGAQLPNPYLVPNMAQAYANVTGQSTTPAVTHLYVRFLPGDFSKMHLLDSIAGAQNFELFDYPLDYEVTSEGEYYHDPSLSASQITWQYAVVTPGFSFPSGISYEVLASIHIPQNSVIEQEAERLAGLNADGDGLAIAASNPDPWEELPNDCQPGERWDPITGQCVPNTCPPGYQWNNTTQQCEYAQIDPVYSPSGKIMVFDTRLDNPNSNTAQPLRRVRLVAYRWFKIEKIFTDNQGDFHFSKYFRRKVKFRAKFENEFCTIRGLREVSALASFFVLQKQIGVYSGSDLNNVTYIFRKTGSLMSNGMRRWAAATILNGVQEHWDYAAQLNFNTAPGGLNIYINPFTNAASTPLFQKRYLTTVPTDFMRTYVASNFVQFTSMFSAFSTVANLDMTIGYNNTNVETESDRVKETVYHEMSHASHYSKSGTGFYNEFVAAEVYEMTANIGNGLSPYGAGTDSYSDIIALGEGWAYFMGRFLADRRYQVNQVSTASPCVEQGITYYNNLPVSGLSSHLNLLEDFNPKRTNEPFYWIPQGLLYDLVDNRNDNDAIPRRVPIDDNVSGYTIQQFNTALESDVKSWSTFRTRLLTQNNNNQAAGVNTIFTFYGY